MQTCEVFNASRLIIRVLHRASFCINHLARIQLRYLSCFFVQRCKSKITRQNCGFPVLKKSALIILALQTGHAGHATGFLTRFGLLDHLYFLLVRLARVTHSFFSVLVVQTVQCWRIIDFNRLQKFKVDIVVRLFQVVRCRSLICDRVVEIISAARMVQQQSCHWLLCA